MKFLAFIVLIITMAATFIPCCEYDDCQNETTGAAQTDSPEKNGTCSPLSTCPTCSGSIVIARTIQLCKPEALKKQMFTPESGSLPLAHPSSFWQPPKLS